MNTWKEIVKSFPSTPFLFVGSGLTRRYLGLPNWDGLLEHFARKLKDDKYTYKSYLSKANNDRPFAATLIEDDFNKRWFDDINFRTKSENVENAVDHGVTPFKAEVAYYIKQFNELNELYTNEINLLSYLSKQNISGFITTNYDNFLESITTDYKTFIGQEQLIFSPIQQMAEIFKIHGSADVPQSIILTKSDYEKFDTASTYLVAKLMTIFVENPIIFIGYSIGDKNIQNIIKDIVTCMSPEHISKLNNRFIFVKHNKNLKDSLEISKILHYVDDKAVPMTQIETDNYYMIYEGLKDKCAAVPVRTLRFFKDQFYLYAQTAKPSKFIMVNINDANLNPDQLCISLGLEKRMAKMGYTGIGVEDWYKNVIYDNYLECTSDELLSYSFTHLFKSQGQFALPIFKYISSSTNDYSEIIETNGIKNFDDLFNKGQIKGRHNKTMTAYALTSITAVANFASENGHLKNNSLYYASLLTEHEININDLKHFILRFLDENPTALSENYADDAAKSNLKRLIRVYDWLKYH